MRANKRTPRSRLRYAEPLEARRVLSTVLVPAGSTWNFLADTQDAPAGWQARDFDDGAWQSGPAEIGYGDWADNRPEVTEIGLGVPTVYFRHEFNVADPEQVAALSLSLVRDDGAAVYLNGVDVVRDNIPAGATFWTEPSRLITGFEERQWLHFSGISPSLLVPGANVLAVEVHSSMVEFYSDLSFDLSLQVPDVQSIAVGQSGGGSIGAVGEFDIWRFAAQAGDYIAIDVDQDATAGNLEFTLHAPRGVPLIFPMSVDNENTGDLPTTRVPATGVYTLEFSDNAGGLGSYQFELLDIATPSPTPLTLGQVAEGSVESFGVLDHWQFSLGAGRKIFFDFLELAPAAEGAMVFFKLLDPTGQYINGRTASPGQDHTSIDLPFTLTAAGTYTLEVENETPLPAGYRFQIFDVTNPDVQDITIGQIVDGAVATPGSFDVFRLNVSGSPRVFVDVRQQSGGALDWRLVDPGGTTVLTATGSGADPNGGDLGAIVLNTVGIWRIEVDGQGDDTGEYQFQVLSVPEPDVFTLELGAVAEGAIEAPGATDRWTFVVPANTSVYLDVQEISAGRLHFRRLNVNGVVASSTGDASDPNLADRPHNTHDNSPRTYTLEVDGDRDTVASYRFQLFVVHVDALAGGVGIPMAGSVESPGSRDEWTFQVATGADVLFDVQQIGGTGQRLSFRLERLSEITPFFPQTIVTSEGASGLGSDADRGPLYLLSGNYKLTVAGVGDDTASYQLQLRPAAVQPDTLVAAGAVWRYLDDGSNQGTAWTATGFDDSTWPSGPAKLGYGNQTELTVLRTFSVGGSGITTYYFRRTFQVAEAAAYHDLNLYLKRDDGVAVYLNGQQILREFLPDDADYLTRATMAAPDDGEVFNFYGSIPASRLVDGINMLAVEIHNVTVGGADIGFDLALIGRPVATVVGRHVFYNNSAWDGNGGADAADDGAIATDKVPLLPGGTASFANYTSYSKGITGVMIDVAGLPAGSLSADDFRFHVGNNNAAGTWTEAPSPSAMTVRRGAGSGGADRITLAWPDGAIKQQWLQVTMLAGANLGLAADDVFYFGNAIGEAGDSTANALVNATDEILARSNPRNILNPAPVDFLYDFNRDKLVNATDQIIARTNSTNIVTALRLIAPTATPGGGPLAAALVDAVQFAGEDEPADMLLLKKRR